MSKYYKAEDVIRAIEEMQNGYNGWSDSFDKAQIIGVLDDLPTIEVSEEQLSKLQASEKSVENTTVSEDFTSISRANSKLEVSEDAISREYLKSFEYINKGDFNSVETIREWIDNAPSVVPKPKEGEWILDPNGMDWNLPAWKCSECGGRNDNIPPYICKNGERIDVNPYSFAGSQYCRYCGAKMKGAE